MNLPLNYLTEGFQIAYIKFISETEKKSIDMQKTYLRENSIYGKYSPLNIIIFLLLIQLEKIGLSDEKIVKVANQIKSSFQENICPFMIDYCILIALKGEDVNLYISGSIARIMPASEYHTIQSLGNSDVIVISVNRVLGCVFQNVSEKKNNSVFFLSKKESEILSILRDTEDVKEVAVSYKNHQDSPSGYSIKKAFRGENMNELYRIAHKIGFGSLEVSIFDGKYHTGTMKKDVKFDKKR